MCAYVFLRVKGDIVQPLALTFLECSERPSFSPFPLPSVLRLGTWTVLLSTFQKNERVDQAGVLLQVSEGRTEGPATSWAGSGLPQLSRVSSSHCSFEGQRKKVKDQRLK